MGILLLYYQPFSAEATRRFADLLRSVDKDSVLVIVENQKIERSDTTMLNTHVIAGNNTLHEFSGWQVGLDYCKRHDLIPHSGILVFANDTFCHHNKFGPISEWAFVHSFKLLLKDSRKLSLTGEVHPCGSVFSIDGQNFSQWVSTYLFAMTVSLSEKVQPLTTPLNLEQFFTHQVSLDGFLTGPLNDNLKRHLVNYLFGVRGSAKWYAAAPLSVDNMPRFVSKAKSILCEMHLSATTLSFGGELASVFKSRFIRQARRLERLLPRYRLPPSVSK